jgi:uncharacterized NAD-dependent epimerase/dehydratase family protein
VSRVRTLLGRPVRLRGRRWRLVGDRVTAVRRSHCTARGTPHGRTPNAPPPDPDNSASEHTSTVISGSNTSDLEEEATHAAVAVAEEETGLVADDVVRFGAERALDAVLEAPSASADGLG